MFFFRSENVGLELQASFCQIVEIQFFLISCWYEEDTNLYILHIHKRNPHLN